MKTFEETKTITRPRLVIRQDGDIDSPRTWSNLGYFITIDRDYNSPDENERLETIVKNSGDCADNLEHHMRLIRTNFNTYDEKVIAIYPITKYEHSGVVYSRGEKHGWDYSNNGFYIITDKTQKEIGTPKKLFEKVIDQEIDMYNKWCNGEVYSYTLYNEAGEIEDTCCGFYDIEDIRDSLPEEWKDEDMSDYLVN